jgi:hypothetical protein
VLAALAVPSVAMIGQMFLGCDRVASVAFFTVALTVNGAVCGGYLGNGLDIAPNFSGTVQHVSSSLLPTVPTFFMCEILRWEFSSICYIHVDYSV